MTNPSETGDAREAILALLTSQRETKGSGLSICPTQVAKRLEGDAGGEAWRRHLPLVRRTAVAMAKSGDIAITRKGKPVDPDTFKGVYRLALPADEDESGQSASE